MKKQKWNENLKIHHAYALGCVATGIGLQLI
jgi:hypothetical protein